MFVHVCLCVCLGVFFLTFSMHHCIVILHGLGLNIHSMVTYIYNLSSVSSGFYQYSKFTFGFLKCYLLLFDFVSTALLTD